MKHLVLTVLLYGAICSGTAHAMWDGIGRFWEDAKCKKRSNYVCTFRCRWNRRRGNTGWSSSTNCLSNFSILTCSSFSQIPLLRFFVVSFSNSLSGIFVIDSSAIVFSPFNASIVFLHSHKYAPFSLFQVHTYILPFLSDFSGSL